MEVPGQLINCEATLGPHTVIDLMNDDDDYDDDDLYDIIYLRKILLG